ncbi:MAG: ABC transporter permease [Magnetococcales bacterium]|nr:ABC transporter permease [Magnetococcales bacterium]
MTTHPPLLSATGVIAACTLREVMRDRWVWTAALMIGAGWVLALFFGELLLTGTEGSQAAILGFFFRLGCVFQMATLVTFAVARELQNRGFDLILALPFPRAVVFMGRFLGFAMVAVLLALVCGLALLPLVPAGQAVLWSMALGCELLLMAGVSLVLTLTLRQAPLAMTLTAGFYLLARSMGTLLLIARQTSEMNPHWSSIGAKIVVTCIAGVLPGLDHFTASEWLVYQTGSFTALLPILEETGIYLLLLIATGLVDLYGKDF